MSRLWSVRLVGATFASLSTFVILESIRDRSKYRLFSIFNVFHITYFLLGSIPSLSIRQQEEAITTTVVYRQKLQEMIQEANDPTNTVSSMVQTTVKDMASSVVDLFHYLKKSMFK